MIIYSLQKEIWQDSFIGREKLVELPFNCRVFTDHLSLRHRLKMLHCFTKSSDITVCLNVEATLHSSKYLRPYSFFDYVVSHKNTSTENCFYYSIGVEHIANENFLDLRKVSSEKANKDNSAKICWITSNYAKISQYNSFVFDLPVKVELFGQYGRKIVLTDNNQDSQKKWIRSSQKTMKNYDAHISIENSNQEGYFSAMPLYSLFSGVVPIVIGENKMHRTVLNPKSYVELNDKTLSREDLNKRVKNCKEFILYASYDDLFAPEFLDYLSFIKEANFFSRSNLKKSQEFRKKLCKES